MRPFQQLAVDTKTRIRAAATLYSTTSPRTAWRLQRMSRRPVIIGGCARSGTSLLLSILSCHPNIFGIAEETVALCPDGYGADGLYNKTPDLEVPLAIWKIYDNLLNKKIPASCIRWCEKTPRNVLYFDRILAYFGAQARLIHIVRDGRDVITSRHPVDPSRFWTTPDRWVHDVAAGRAWEHHPQVHTLRYEDLLQSFEPTVHRLCEFLEEDFVTAFLEYPASAKVKESIAWFDSAHQISTASIGRWRKPEFAERVQALLSERGALELLQHYGYA